MGALIGLKVACTDFDWSTITVQSLAVLQPVVPVQPANWLPLAADACSVTWVDGV